MFRSGSQNQGCPSTERLLLQNSALKKMFQRHLITEYLKSMSSSKKVFIKFMNHTHHNLMYLCSFDQCFISSFECNNRIINLNEKISVKNVTEL